MIASKFVKCLTKLLDLNPYNFILNLKSVYKPKFIAIKENNVNEAEKLNIEKSCENLDLENVFSTLRSCNAPLCKSDVSMLKENNLNHPLTSHSDPCCNLKLNYKSRQILEHKSEASVAPIMEIKMTKTQSTCTAPMKECKSVVYILDQRKQNIPKKPLSAPCRTHNHDEAVRKLCEKAMKTCAEARKIISFYKYNKPKPEDWVQIKERQIENKSTIKLKSIKTQNLVTKTKVSDTKLTNTPCPYCTLPSTIPKNYACPFCAKNVKNCTCIHCPHCKKSRISGPNKTPPSKTKFFRFDEPINYVVSNKSILSNVTLQEKIATPFTEKSDFKIESKTRCKISQQKTKKLFSSKSEDKTKLPKSMVEKKHKKKSISREIKDKSVSNKSRPSSFPNEQELVSVWKNFDKILTNKRFDQNLPNEELKLPWMTYTNEAKSSLVMKVKNSIKERSLNGQNQKKVVKSLDRKQKMSAKQKSVDKQNDSYTSAVSKQSKDRKVRKKTKNLEKTWTNNSSECSLMLIYPIKANRPVAPITNVTFIRNYCSKEDDSRPRDVLCDCPKVLREIDKCEQMEHEEYFDGCYNNPEYFQYHKYSYFDFEECMKKKRLPQPDPRERYDDCD